MGIEPPFLYDPPSKWNDISLKKPFNPKSVTDAAQAPQIPRHKPEGPLLNFNVHPDSYLILPYGNVGKSPMSRHTKINVQVARGVQLVFRTGELLVTIAILVCVICLRNLDSNASWCFRIPPCVGLVHSLYGAYHHLRSATTKPPATTASYNFVAAGLDTSLIPFYAFMCLLSSNQLNAASIGWTTVFADPVKDRTIVNLTFLLTIVIASMHWLSLLLSLFLAVIFRKITRLPPDMNPLESNLTTRHKKKTSEATSHRWSKSTTFAESEASESPRQSVVAAGRTIPFMHTRAGSNAPSDAASNRFSRTDLPSQVQEAMSKRSSRVDLARSLPKRASKAEVLSKETIMRNSRETLTSENWYTYLGAQNEGNENNARTSTMLSDYTKKSDTSIYHSVAEDEDDVDERRLSEEVDLGDALNVHIHEINDFNETSRWEDDEELEGDDLSRPSSSGTVETYPATRTLGLNPLGLNPPTPTPDVQEVRRASPVPVHVRPVSRPQSKFYGDLRAGTPPVIGPKKGEVIDLTADDEDDHRKNRVISTGSEMFNEKGGRRRDVSGKVAEEGRGGKESNAWWAAARRSLSGRRVRDE